MFLTYLKNVGQKWIPAKLTFTEKDSKKKKKQGKKHCCPFSYATVMKRKSRASAINACTRTHGSHMTFQTGGPEARQL